MSAENPTLFEAISQILLGYGTHADRPAATDVPINAIYAETDTLEVYQNQAGTWVQIADVGGGGGGAVDSVSGTAPIAVDTPTGDVTISHDASGVTPDTYGDATHVAQITVDAEGHVTDAVDIAIAAGGTPGLTLVERKTITANTTTVTFSGLDGNTDGTYLLTGKIINNSGAAPFYAMRPNGATTNLKSNLAYNSGSGYSQANGTTGRIFFSQANGTANTFQQIIHAKKNTHSIAQPAIAMGSFTAFDGSNQAIPAFTGWVWDETSTNITSLDIVCESANGIGDGSELCLYKYTQ